MDLTWQKPLNNGGAVVTQYMIEMRCENDGKDWHEVGKTDKMEYTQTGLTFGYKYQFRVHAINKGGMGPPCDPTPLRAARKRKRK